MWHNPDVTLVTKGGLGRQALKRSNDGRRIVSAKMSAAAAVRLPGSNFALFGQAREIVRAREGFGFMPCGGKTEAGQLFLKLTREKFQELKQ